MDKNVDGVRDILLGWATRIFEDGRGEALGSVRIQTDCGGCFLAFGEPPVVVEEGVAGGSLRRADCTISISSEDLLQLGAGTLNPQNAFLEGRVRLSGDGGVALRMSRFFL